MKVLLDTHIFIWWAFESDKLSQQGRAVSSDPRNTLGLSVASLWEMQIKIQLGKLSLPSPLAEVVVTQQKMNALVILPINSDHVLALQGLPVPHKDPFDRLLVAQAIVEDMYLMTVDRVFQEYPVRVLN